jgi:hypothetical protein
MSLEQPYSLFKLVQSTLVALSHEINNSHFIIDATEKELLLPGKIDEVTRKITEAIRPKLASFLVSGKDFTITKYLTTD